MQSQFCSVHVQLIVAQKYEYVRNLHSGIIQFVASLLTRNSGGNLCEKRGGKFLEEIRERARAAQTYASSFCHREWKGGERRQIIVCCALERRQKKSAGCLPQLRQKNWVSCGRISYTMWYLNARMRQMEKQVVWVHSPNVQVLPVRKNVFSCYDKVQDVQDKKMSLRRIQEK